LVLKTKDFLYKFIPYLYAKNMHGSIFHGQKMRLNKYQTVSQNACFFGSPGCKVNVTILMKSIATFCQVLHISDTEKERQNRVEIRVWHSPFGWESCGCEFL